jgi:hypothetical protein
MIKIIIILIVNVGHRQFRLRDRSPHRPSLHLPQNKKHARFKQSVALRLSERSERKSKINRKDLQRRNEKPAQSTALPRSRQPTVTLEKRPVPKDLREQKSKIPFQTTVRSEEEDLRPDTPKHYEHGQTKETLERTTTDPDQKLVIKPCDQSADTSEEIEIGNLSIIQLL